MKRLLLIVLPLFISVGFCQELIRSVERDKNGDLTIIYYKETRNRIDFVRYVGYHGNGNKKIDGRFVSYSIPLVPNTPFLQRSVNAKAAIVALKPFSEKLAAMYIALYEKVEE